MPDLSLREILINRVLPRVQFPGQYIGGEWNSICKDPAAVRGRLCLAFPEPYTIGMSHYGLQVLYAIMNGRSDWACERAFTPLTDLESLLRRAGTAAGQPGEFHAAAGVRRRRLQPAARAQRDERADDARSGRNPPGGRMPASMADPLILAGGPGSANPEPMARFIDAFVLGDGEEALPAVCDLWLEMRQRRARPDGCLGPPGRDAALCLRAAVLRTAVRRPRPAGGTAADARRSAAGHRAGRGAGLRRRAGARGPDRAVHRVRSRADRHRDHAGLSVAMPFLPEPRLEASGPLPPRGDDCRRGPAGLSGDRASRSRPAGALVERLSADRRVADAAACRLPAAGREHFACPACG